MADYLSAIHDSQRQVVCDLYMKKVAHWKICKLQVDQLCYLLNNKNNSEKFTKIFITLGLPQLTSKTTGISWSKTNDSFVSECIAVYSYSGEVGDLSFTEGDVIKVLKADGDWWEGTCKGERGLFPANYVKKKELEV